jgi:uroporphyrin-3 C-methyltransferase
VAALGAWSGWSAQQRLSQLESELVRRQQDSQTLAQESRLLSRQAQEQAKEAAARAQLLETRLTEVALQRSQVEDLVKTMSRSRDENLLVDIEAGLRVALQQSAMTGSVEPVMTALQTADERLARAQQPRLEPVRRAVAKDIDRIKATRVADLPSLAIRLDEAIRLVDEVPLVSERTLHADSAPTPKPAASDAAPTPPEGRLGQVLQWGQQGIQVVWREARSLVRIARIDRPESMLVAPEQAFFLRENLKLRLLNARLALLSRQTATAMSDLQLAQGALTRYFDMGSRKAQLVQGQMAEVLMQANLTTTPRPDDTLAALTTLGAGR